MYALCIIDLQEGFRASNGPNLRHAVTREIELAKRRNYPILVVEYSGFGKTESWVKEAIGSYPAKYCTKKTDDGSKAILGAGILKRHFGAKNYRICGINTDACIEKTVDGLICGIDPLQQKIEVVKDGCWSVWDLDKKNHPANHQRGIKRVREMGAKIIRG